MKLPVFVLNCLQRVLTESFLNLAVHPHNGWLADRLRQESNSNDMRVAKAYHTQMEWRPALSLLAHLPKVLIVHGADDRIIPIECGQHLHNIIPSSELLVVDSASHLVHMEQAPRVATAILSFLSRTATR
jgi:pimeloyl-ACP methyl ester carboxylesterase